jgi:hypothetical protein
MDIKALEQLGFSKEEIISRVVDRIAEDILSTAGIDEDGNPEQLQSTFKRQIDKKVQERIDASLSNLASRVISDDFEKFLSGLNLQQTNGWGEAKKPPQSFVEYITESAHKFLSEQVDREGKPKRSDSYSWTAEGTRAMWLVNTSMQKNIVEIMNQTLKGHNQTVAEAIAAAVKAATLDVQSKLQLTVKTR